MKKVFAFTLAAALLAGMAISASAEEPAFEEQEIVLNFDQTENSVMGQNLAVFADLVSEKTGGQVTVKVYYNGSLFPQGEQYEACIKGSCDMVLNAISNATQYVPELEIAFCPYIWASMEHWNNFWATDTGKELDEKIHEQAGVRYVAWFCTGLRDLALADDMKVTSRDQLKAVKLRAVPETSYQFLVEALGANPVPIALSDTYLAIQTGTADGLEIPMESLIANGMQDILGSVTRTNHMLSTIGFVVSEKSWNSWTPELQQVITEAAQECAANITDTLKAQEQETMAQLEEAGVTIYTLTDEEMKAYRQEVLDYVLSTETAEAWDMDLYAAIEAANN